MRSSSTKHSISSSIGKVVIGIQVRISCVSAHREIASIVQGILELLSIRPSLKAKQQMHRVCRSSHPAS
jgi:hypothetical protein